ncbi:MAG TPA: hypothetical protein VJO32_05895 [Ktedonobacteraceae bacterium]|nr:hypothetical protein [Ktedonobacteraceae bacterium]
MATTNGMTPSENARVVASMITEDDLAELQALHLDLQKRIDAARQDGRLFMMGQYVRLQAMVSPEISRVERRFKRETLAANRKEHKALKLEAKAAAEAATV